MFISQNLIGPTSIAIRATVGCGGFGTVVLAEALRAAVPSTQEPDNTTAAAI
jgi:hypothetical protein